MNLLHLNCISGASGDMIVGSLLDLGVHPQTLFGELNKLGVGSYDLSVKKVEKKGVVATKFMVNIYGIQPSRRLSDILALIDESGLGERVKQRSRDIFKELGQAEADAHGTSIDDVHFHEVGAVDSIVDIVSTAILLDKLDIAEVYCSTIPLGNGKVHTAHGLLNVPTPAVKNLLKEAPIVETRINAELTTPTGAAIIKTIANGFCDVPFEAHQVGYGAGTYDLSIPNVLETRLIKRE